MIRNISSIFLILTIVIFSSATFAQNTDKRVSITVKDSEITKKDTAVGKPSVTHHQMMVDGKSVSYTATAGYMPMRDKDEKLIAKMFYVAYTGDNTGSKTKRPVTFVFNGGPGSAAIWLHMGSFSPVRVKFANDKGDAPSAPFQYEENPYTWLGFTDLVFIDPISTGYSRAMKGVDVNLFHGYNEDVASVGDFIRLYITKNERWESPKFIAGESYGTTRAAGLSGYLQDRYGMYLNGITLISSVLNFQLIDFKNGNEMAYIYFLPTFANTAQYHHKLSTDLQSLSPADLTKKVELFANGTYSYFLSKGDEASPELVNRVVDSLNYFTGIPKDYIRQANERITDSRFLRKY